MWGRLLEHGKLTSSHTPSKNKFSSPRRYQLKQGMGSGEPLSTVSEFSWLDFAPVSTDAMSSCVGYPCHVLKTVCTAPFPSSRSHILSASSLGIFPKPRGLEDNHFGPSIRSTPQHLDQLVISALTVAPCKIKQL